MSASAGVGILLMCAAVALGSAIGASQSPPAATLPADHSAGPAPTTTSPVPRADQWWIDRHNAIMQRRLEQPWDVVFIGDSITQGWENPGASVWNAHFAQRRALNLGFSGDRTQHVLWRLDNQEVDGYQPRLAVVMIGTNNSNGQDHSAEEIAAGIKAVVARLRQKQPNMKILLLAVFPRGETPNPQREKNARASKAASAVADGQMVHYLDIGSKFVDEHGAISREIMPDFLHLSERGYQLWADAIKGKVAELLDEREGEASRTPPQE